MSNQSTRRFWRVDSKLVPFLISATLRLASNKVCPHPHPKLLHVTYIGFRLGLRCDEIGLEFASDQPSHVSTRVCLSHDHAHLLPGLTLLSRTLRLLTETHLFPPSSLPGRHPPHHSDPPRPPAGPLIAEGPLIGQQQVLVIPASSL
jgi:hypothetical protein